MPCRRITVEEFNNLPPGTPNFPNEDACTCCGGTGDCGTCGGSWSVPLTEWYSQPPSEWNNTSPCTAVGGVFFGDSDCQFQRIKPAGGCSSLDIPPAPQYQYVTAIWSGWSEGGGATCCGGTCVQTIDFSQWQPVVQQTSPLCLFCGSGCNATPIWLYLPNSSWTCSNGTYKGTVRGSIGFGYNPETDNFFVTGRREWSYEVTTDSSGNPTGATNFVLMSESNPNDYLTYCPDGPVGGSIPRASDLQPPTTITFTRI